ncbi:PQQ-dependent protein, partial [Bacillus toyonensis]
MLSSNFATEPENVKELGTKNNVSLISSGQFAYVANLGSNNVSVINTVSNTVVATIPVGLSPRNVAITPNAQFAYVVNGVSDNVSVINTASNTVFTTIPGGSSPRGIAITPNGTFAYVANT